MYIRAALVITWKDSDGIIYYKKPVEGKDYELLINSDDWFLGDDDGYYYYKYPVESGDHTKIFIESCEVTGTAPEDGYTLSVEIISQTVQALGSTDSDDTIPAVEDAWDIVPDSRTTPDPAPETTTVTETQPDAESGD